MTPTLQTSARRTQIFSVLIAFMLIILLAACGGNEAPTTTDPTPETPATTAPADTSEEDGPDVGGASETETRQFGAIRLAPSEDGSALEIWVDDVSDLAAIDVAVQFDPAQMQATDVDGEMEGIQIAAGEAPSPDFVADNMVDNEEGLVRYAAVRLPPSLAFTGTGRVASIQWAGEFNLDAVTLGEVAMANSKGEALEP